MQYRGSYLSYLLMYLFYFLSLALLSGLISVYLLDRGYSASQVSLVVASSYIVSVILQPLVGYLNDHFNLKCCFNYCRNFRNSSNFCKTSF